MDWTKKQYTSYRDWIWGWIEDTYLKYHQENRASYGTKESLKKTQVTGDENVDQVQGTVNDTAGNALAPGQVGGVVGSTVDQNILKGRTG